ncbi:hypothetical protein MKZ38_007310 [Zalerion maritima]|uniref:Protein TED1 n=1 Tax=Zalerion maritima TaxID=339359 RepID=A0AAD5RI33_9PEZI|nr:hypothetical protein MKZ38_007310 [Zalerion maritima]
MISPAVFLRKALRLLVPLAVILSSYLYYYPVFLGCAFPLPDKGPAASEGSSAYFETLRQHVPFLAPLSPIEANSSTAPDTDPGSEATPPLFPSRQAPFRLLALGDPQLEGDSSIPNTYKSSPFPHLVKLWKRAIFKTQMPSLRQRVRWMLHDIVDFYFEDIPDTIESIRKRIDHAGNDFYLSLVYKTMHWWTKPTHVTVLGDLVGSQWIDDAEFERRGKRYWNTVFEGSEKVPHEVAAEPENDYSLTGFLGIQPNNETETWERRLINVAGNHDIGYAGDLTVERLERFEKMFGKANYELRFELPVSEAAAPTILSGTNEDSDRLPPELRIVVLNNMNLDTPAICSELQDATYGFINKVITTSTAVEYKGHFTVLLTHIPLYKPEGVCIDGPFFEFFEEDMGSGLKEQNQLSEDASRGFLEGIYGLSGNPYGPGKGHGRPGVILNGHDHEGCDTYHFVNQSFGEGPQDRSWEVKRWRQAKRDDIPGNANSPGVREFTARSMMGNFGGYAGLLSAWFDEDVWEWKYEFATCSVGTHNLWWLTHVLDLIAIGGIILYPVAVIWEASAAAKQAPVAHASKKGNEVKA